MTTPLLTLVTDRSRARSDLPTLARKAVDGGVDVVQIREPDLDPVQLHATVSDVVAAVGAARVAVNDAPAIAAALGVHLHLPERSAAGFPGCPDGGTVSASVHSVESAARAPAHTSYLIAGHLYPTSTHPDTAPLGVEGLRAIVAASSRPVVAIGGMTPVNVAEALSSGAVGVAVISYVNCSNRPDLAARELRDSLEHAMTQLVAISVQVNGKAMSVLPGATLTAFLESRNLHPRLVVVERNRLIVPKSAYDSTILEEGDLLEIAHFVGGG